MRTLTNNFSDCELLNLGYHPNGRGPYVIRQDGTPPASMTIEEDRFLLRKDGTWMLNLSVFSLPEKQQEEFIYNDVAAVQAVTDKLVGKPNVLEALPEGKSKAELMAALDSTQSRLWRRIREVRGTKPG